MENNILFDRWKTPVGLQIKEALLFFLTHYKDTKEDFERIREISKPIHVPGDYMPLFLDYRGLIFENEYFEQTGPGYNFDYSIFKSTSFVEVGFSNGYLRKSRLEECTFQKCSFDAIAASHLECYNSAFENCDFYGSELDNSSFVNCFFHLCNFPGAQVDNADFTGAKFEQTLFGIRGKNVKLDAITFHGFWGIRETIELYFFRKAEIPFSKFEEIKLIECDFTEANLESSLFVNSSFTRVTFFHSNLSFCRFENCDCREVDFSTARMQGVEFINCQMEGAVLPASSTLKPELSLASLQLRGYHPSSFQPAPGYLSLPASTLYVWLPTDTIRVLSIERADVLVQTSKGTEVKLLQLPVKITSYASTLGLQVQGNWKVMHQEEVIHVTDGLLLEVPKEKVELMNAQHE
jgi:uncharacterized protein YjbI with pentapeptide repeats